jgi:hypothetical protein
MAIGSPPFVKPLIFLSSTAGSRVTPLLLLRRLLHRLTISSPPLLFFLSVPLFLSSPLRPPLITPPSLPVFAFQPIPPLPLSPLLRSVSFATVPPLSPHIVRNCSRPLLTLRTSLILPMALLLTRCLLSKPRSSLRSPRRMVSRLDLFGRGAPPLSPGLPTTSPPYASSYALPSATSPPTLPIFRSTTTTLAGAPNVPIYNTARGR